MFTGIITNLGTMRQRENDTFTFTTDAALCKKLSSGTSISVNGVCLTVLEKPTGNDFSVTIMPETSKKTTLHALKEGMLVNLELPATAQTFLSGHIVQGHVDGVGEILAITPDGNSYLLQVSLPKLLSKYVVSKGSIAVNGISLTVIEAAEDSFTVGIIPHTWEHTMLHTVEVGEYVTIETDVLAKYVERLLTK